MLVFGIDVPLIEVVFVLAIVVFFLLVEAIVLIGMLINQSKKSRKLVDLVEKLSQTLLEIKKAEIQELDKLKRK
jgi:hypothetical protein